MSGNGAESNAKAQAKPTTPVTQPASKQPKPPASKETKAAQQQAKPVDKKATKKEETAKKQEAAKKEETAKKQEATKKEETAKKQEAAKKEEAAKKQEAAKKEEPPAAKTGTTDDAKNNCPEKQVKACDVTLYKMKVIPRKKEDATDDPSENTKELQTDKQLRGPLSPKDIAQVKKYGQEYVDLLRKYDLIIETSANYITADSGPETTLDFEVEAEWEGSCTAHPLLTLEPHSNTADQDALLVPAATGKAAELSAVDHLTYKVNKKDEKQTQLREGTASKFAGKATWPIGTKKVAVKDLTALGIVDDIVDAEEAGILRTLMGIGGVVWALDKTVDLEIFADSDGAAATKRTANKHLNGLLRIYRATEIGIELSIPWGTKVTQKKERGEVTEAREREDPLNAAGKRKWELRLKVDNFEIPLDGDESQDGTAWQGAEKVGGYAKERWDNRATIRTDVRNDIEGARTELNRSGTTGYQAARAEIDELKQNAGRLKNKANKAIKRSTNAAKRARRDLNHQWSTQDIASGTAPGPYKSFIRSIVRAWKMLCAALKQQGGVAKQFIKLLKKWPKLGFFFDFEYSFLNVTLSATLERISRPGDPILGRLIPLIGNVKFAVEGVLFEGKIKVGFGVDFEFSSHVHIEVALEGEGDGKAPIKLEASPFDDSKCAFEGELNLKLAAVFQVEIGIFKFETKAELATGIRPEGEIKWVADKRKLTGEIKLRSIPLTLSGSYTEPGFGTKSEVASIELVEPKELYKEEFLSWVAE